LEYGKILLGSIAATHADMHRLAKIYERIIGSRSINKPGTGSTKIDGMGKDAVVVLLTNMRDWKGK
jgi:hypothetical protein